MVIYYINFIKALDNKKNVKKKIIEVYDIHQLREAYYWINISARMQINI